MELGGNDAFTADELQSLFSMLQKQMRKDLRSTGRREVGYALQYWKNSNSGTSMLSPVPFNKVAKASFSSQASSASAERLFSDLGRQEGRSGQSNLSFSLEMNTTIRAYVRAHIRDSNAVQTGLVHPEGVAFKRICNNLAMEVAKKQ